MKITEGIGTLDLTVNNQGNQRLMYPTLLWDQKEAILVDTSIPGQWPSIHQAINQMGVPLCRLNRIILTHQDYDHIGSLPQLLEDVNQKVEVLAHTAEKPYIEGDKPLLKMSQERLAGILDNFPPDQRSYAEKLYKLHSQVDRTVEDGEVLPYCGGIKVFHTPGHTPGHVCLYHHTSQILIAGDALNICDGQLQGPNPVFTPDPERAKDSLKKLLGLDIKAVICFHGGIFSGNVQDSLQKLLKL